MNFWILLIMFALIGIMIGIFGTLLFFRLDKSWKQILVGLGSAFSAFVTSGMVNSYFGVKEENRALLFLVLIIALMVSVFFSFKFLCKMIKSDSGNVVIRILDIVLGYDGFLKDYYESRMKDVERGLGLEEIGKRTMELNNKEAYLKELESGINEQKKDTLVLKLPENSEFAITSRFLRQIPIYVNHICKFKNNVEKLTNDFLKEFNDDKEHNKECLKGYFTGIGIYVANDLFGTRNEDVRTHFRILQDEKYVQYTVVLGDKISDDKISDIPRGKSMIEKSFELRKSLVASLNLGILYDTKTQWEDFMTITYYNLSKDKIPFLSMGISIKYKEQFGDMLYFMNFYKIEECLHAYISKINKVCDIVDTLV